MNGLASDTRQEARREVVRVERGRIIWSGISGRPVVWDLGLARYMLDDFAKHPESRAYVTALDRAITEAEAYHTEHA